jgi:hypothetical protein
MEISVGGNSVHEERRRMKSEVGSEEHAARDTWGHVGHKTFFTAFLLGVEGEYRVETP